MVIFYTQSAFVLVSYLHLFWLVTFINLYGVTHKTGFTWNSMYLLDKEIAASEMTALEAVASVDEEKARLEKELEWLSEQEMTPEVESRLNDVYER